MAKNFEIWFFAKLKYMKIPKKVNNVPKKTQTQYPNQKIIKYRVF